VARYPYLVRNHHAFFQQLSLLVRHGYLFWVSGVIPAAKDPYEVDRKLIEKYEVAVSSRVRQRQKREGTARVQYLRHRRTFILVATHGNHPFFAAEGKEVRCFRKQPFKAWDYSISYRAGHPHVRIPLDTYKKVKEYFTNRATCRDLGWWERKLRSFPWEPWAPIRRQVFNLIRHVNRLRTAKRLDPIDWRTCYRLRRKSFKVFHES
jgi:hypothetical protein